MVEAMISAISNHIGNCLLAGGVALSARSQMLKQTLLTLQLQVGPATELQPDLLIGVLTRHRILPPCTVIFVTCGSSVASYSSPLRTITFDPCGGRDGGWRS
jgi:hypothetical protein